MPQKRVLERDDWSAAEGWLETHGFSGLHPSRASAHLSAAQWRQLKAHIRASRIHRRPSAELDQVLIRVGDVIGQLRSSKRLSKAEAAERLVDALDQFREATGWTRTAAEAREAQRVHSLTRAVLVRDGQDQ